MDIPVKKRPLPVSDKGIQYKLNEKENNRRVRKLDENEEDLTFAYVLNIDTTYNEISRDV